MLQVNEIKFRPIKDSDKSFIYSSWLKSYRESDLAKHMVNSIYYDYHAKVIEAAMASSTIIIACNDQDEDQLYGYIVFQQIDDVALVHYTYVKFPYRKFGIGRQLFEFAQPDTEQFTVVTHIPRNFEGLSKKLNLVYNPYRMSGV